MQFTLLILVFTCYFVDFGDSKLINRTKVCCSKAYRILPNNTKDLEILKFIQESSADTKLIWEDTMSPGHLTDVIATHEDQAYFERLLKKYHMSYFISSDNVEKLIEEEAEQNNWSGNRLSDQDNLGNDVKRFYDVSRYHSYDDMVKFMNYLKWRYDYMVNVIDLGTTFEGRVIKTIKISYPSNGSSKRSIWIDAGIHAREWASHSTAMYFVNLLTTQYALDPKIREYVNNFTWYITPVLNPDGYEYSRSAKSVNVRFWRKNRSKTEENCKPHKCCIGVDLNRNFDFFWNDLRSVKNPCAEDFRGPEAFSENETRAVRDFMNLNSYKIDAFITLHTYSQFWIYPYGHRASVYPRDVEDLREVAVKATKALKSVHGTTYETGSGADLLYSASGGSEDWMKAFRKVKYSYLLELRPEGNSWSGFSMQTKYLKPIGEETWEGIKVVADAVRKYDDKRKKKS